MPCAVYQTSVRENLMMIPAKAYCPSGWIREYYGYLMTEYKGNRAKSWIHSRTMFECVDKDPEAVPGSYQDENRVLFYHVKASCNGMPCPPYNPIVTKNSTVWFAPSDTIYERRDIYRQRTVYRLNYIV